MIINYSNKKKHEYDKQLEIEQPGASSIKYDTWQTTELHLHYGDHVLRLSL